MNQGTGVELEAPRVRTAGRQPALDALRGWVMVVMALDHARDYLSPTPFQPTDLTETTPALFWTRWVTHLCAPVFVFLAGTGAWFKGKRSSPAELSRYLWTRGAWLVLLEVVLNNPLWFGAAWVSFTWFVQLQVLWAIGVSMIALGFLVRLPRGPVALLAFGMIAGHNLLDGIGVAAQGERGWGDWVWGLLHVPLSSFYASDPFAWKSTCVLSINYPLIPWIGVMAAGWLFGSWYERGAGPRAGRAAGLAGVLLLGFLVLRSSNLYGEPVAWEGSERGTAFTVLSFFNLTKYPPSLLFLAATLGLACGLLALFERLPARWLGPLVVFGRVPLFFYFAHVLVLNLFSVGVGLATGRVAGWWLQVLYQLPVEGYEPHLGWAYLGWTAAVALLFPVCLWWGRVKAARPDSWVQLF